MLAPKSHNSSGSVTCHSCGKISHLQKHYRTINSGSSQSRSGLRSGTKSKIDYCFYCNRYHKSPAQLKIITEEIQKMIEQDIWNSPTHPGEPLVFWSKRNLNMA